MNLSFRTFLKEPYPMEIPSSSILKPFFYTNPSLSHKSRHLYIEQELFAVFMGPVGWVLEFREFPWAVFPLSFSSIDRFHSISWWFIDSSVCRPCFFEIKVFISLSYSQWYPWRTFSFSPIVYQLFMGLWVISQRPFHWRFFGIILSGFRWT